jgi:uncharacterized membrane protein (DUF106 family)
MSLINALFRGLFDALLAPLRGLPAMVGLVPISLVVAVFALYVFKWTSNQEAMEQVKARIHAGIFEIRLFNDDMRAILRAQVEILGHVLNQLRLTLIPLVWMLIPLWVIISHLQFHYGYRGLEVDRSVLVKATFAEGSNAVGDGAKPEFRLEAPAGVRVETPSLWIPSQNELVWRVAAEAEGDYELQIVGADGSLTSKSLRSSDRIVRRSPKRGRSLVDQLVYPAEAPLDADSPFVSITVGYSEGDVNMFGWETNWLIAFFILSMVFGFALRKPLGVTI